MTELEIEQLAHFSPEQKAAIHSLVDEIASRSEGPGEEDLNLLRKQHSAAAHWTTPGCLPLWNPNSFS